MVPSSFYYTEESMSENRITHWKSFPKLDSSLRTDLENYSAAQLQDAFYTDLEFGTAGMRGLLGAGPNRMNIYTIRKANVAFAKYLLQYPDAKTKGVAIAYDNRLMSKEFSIESARVLAMFDIPSYVFTSLRPTPELSFAVRYLTCIGGIVITASHNPKEYNGYKVYDDKGCQLIPELIDQVIAETGKIKDELAIDVQLTPQQEKLIQWIDFDVDKPYEKRVLAIQNRPEQDKSNSKIVFTPQHGTAYHAVMNVLAKAGYHVIPVQAQCTPDPLFSNTKTPNPEEKAAYDMAIEVMKAHGADAAFSTDPDADRVGVVVVHKGEYRLLTGNQTGSILLDYIFSTKLEKGTMPKHPVIFNTVVTSDLGEKVADSYHVETEKTLTGFKFIGEKIAKYEVNHLKDFVFGYEESYGYLVEPFVRDKDAIQSCLLLAEAITYYKNQGKTLVDVLESLYAKFGWYIEDQVSLSLKGEEGSKRIKAIMEHFQQTPIDAFAGIKIIAKEDYRKSQRVERGVVSKLDFPLSDVIKYFLEDGSWIAIRPSGTEPKCKFYFCVVDKSKEASVSKFELLKSAIAKEIE
jgi:phosphoglucomutase